MKSKQFMAGINVEGDDARESPKAIVDVLKLTPIKWLRIHSLPTRSLDEKGSNKFSYLDSIEYFCKKGYNIMAPVEVGYVDNVGIVEFEDLDNFIDRAYEISFNVSRQIAKVTKKYKVKLILGIENEIDIKSWILQALPNIQWRASFETWIKLAANPELKYKLLNNILKGIRDAEPDVKTITNVLAESSNVFSAAFGHLKTEVEKHSELLKKHSVDIEEISDENMKWEAELKRVRDNLDVDLIGLDTYPNYLIKYPIKGDDIGDRIDKAIKLTHKPALNLEFGYSTYRNLLDKMILPLFSRQTAGAMQLQFFSNALNSIGKSNSVGAFPWVLISHPDRVNKPPKEEGYFGLFKMKGKILKKTPAFDYYVNWLRRTNSS